MGSLRRARKSVWTRRWAFRSWLVLALVGSVLGLGTGTAYADAPTAYDTSDATFTGVGLAVFLPADDVDGDPLTYAIVSGPSHGSLTGDCTDGDCTYTSSAGYTGADSFTWKANDGTADSNTATYAIDVAAPGAPTAYPNSTEAGGDAMTTLTLSGSDDGGADLTFAISTPPSHGTLSAIRTPSCDAGFCEAEVDYTPTAAYRGPDSFEFTVKNATQTSAPATVSLSVVNAPCTGVVITNGTVKLGVNCSGDLNVGEVGLRYVPTDNDSTAPGCPCEGWGAADSISNITGYANESAGTSSNLNVVDFTHDADSATSVTEIGTKYRVTHDYQPSAKTPNVYDVTVTVKNISASDAHLRYRRVMDWDIEPTPFNEYVTVNKGTASEIVFTSDNGFATADALAGPSDIGFTGNFTDAGPADHGALFDFDFGTLAAGASRTFQTYYGAAATETGALDALNKIGAEAYSLGQPSTPDGPTLGTPNTFLFAFGAVGGAPIFSPVANDDTLTTTQGTAGSKDVLANDTDPNGDTLTVTGKTDGAHGTVSCTAAGVCTYTPTGSYTGPDSFTYTIDDGHGGTDVGTVNVTVTAVAHPPVATDDTLTTPEDTAGSKNVLTNDTDADGDTLTVIAKTNGAHGTVSCTAAGVCTYTPAANYNGPDTFTYTVSDGHGGTDVGTVNVTVTPVNDPPLANADTLTTPQATPGSKNVLTNDTDADGDALSVTGKTDGAHGTVSCTAAGVCTYTPTGSYTGADSFTYTASDGHGGTATGTVNVTVTPVNHPPVLTDDTLTTPEDTAATKNVLTNDTDSDGDTLTVTGKTNGAHGTVTCLSNGACTYTPAANYHGADAFTYTVSDGHGGTATGNVAVTVTPVNDPPVANDDTLSTAFETAKTLAVLGNDTDVDGDLLTVTAKTDGAHGTVSCTVGGSCTYTPAAGYSGPDSFTYTADDTHGGTDVGTVNVTVAAKPGAADVSVVKTPLAGTVGVGNLTGYTLSVHNGSGVAAPTVSVTDALPTGFKMRDASGQPCVLIGNTLTCSFGLAAGETRTIVVNGAFIAAGTIANTATVSSAGDPNAANDSSRATTVVTGKTCTIVGTFGDDNPLLGTNKADVICGLSGNDKINGKQGDDTIYGNDGNDRLNGLGGNDLIDGGPGTDTVTYAALQQSVRVNLGTHKATGQGSDTFVSIENVTGSPRSDVMVGDARANRLEGLDGNDTLSGAAGNDTLVGGSGKDVLKGGAGNDRIVGGPGKDSCSQGTGKGTISC